MQIASGIVLFLIASVSATSARLAPLLDEVSASAVDGEYIVVFHDSVSEEEVNIHMKYVQKQIVAERTSTKITPPLTSFIIGDFKAYGGKFSDKLRDHIRGMKGIKYVERNDRNEMRSERVSLDQGIGKTLFPTAAQQKRNKNVGIASCYTQPNCPAWGLIRTTSRPRPTSDDYEFDVQAGIGVNVYVLDSGIASNHPDFQGRVQWGTDVVQNPPPKTDLNGHGTLVAGIVMSFHMGVAKQATAIDVRVSDANGVTYDSWIISGLEWVWKQHQPGRKSVVNMSLGTPYSKSLNDAVEAVVNKGIYVVVAAGNSNLDACTISPASAPNAITVTASDINDAWYYVNPSEGNNYGTCTDIIAPGVNILSTTNTGNYAHATGTSFAAPHVAGVIANYLSTINNLPTPAELKRLVVNGATPNIITGAELTSPNKLLYYHCLP